MLETLFVFSSRRGHTRCALVTGVQTCALPIYSGRSMLAGPVPGGGVGTGGSPRNGKLPGMTFGAKPRAAGRSGRGPRAAIRSEEHTSELQPLMRISYAVFCLKKKNKIINN